MSRLVPHEGGGANPLQCPTGGDSRIPRGAFACRRLRAAPLTSGDVASDMRVKRVARRCSRDIGAGDICTAKRWCAHAHGVLSTFKNVTAKRRAALKRAFGTCHTRGAPACLCSPPPPRTIVQIAVAGSQATGRGQLCSYRRVLAYSYLAMGFANVRAGTQKTRRRFWVPARTLANPIARSVLEYPSVLGSGARPGGGATGG